MEKSQYVFAKAELWCSLPPTHAGEGKISQDSCSVLWFFPSAIPEPRIGWDAAQDEGAPNTHSSCAHGFCGIDLTPQRCSRIWCRSRKMKKGDLREHTLPSFLTSPNHGSSPTSAIAGHKAALNSISTPSRQYSWHEAWGSPASCLLGTCKPYLAHGSNYTTLLIGAPRFTEDPSKQACRRRNYTSCKDRDRIQSSTQPHLPWNCPCSSFLLPI